MDSNHLTTYLEWEAINFPLLINALEIKGANYSFSSETYIQIRRTEQYYTEAIIKGHTKEPKKLRDNAGFVGKGNIVKGFTIEGLGQDGSKIVLNDCHIERIGEISLDQAETVFSFTAFISFDECRISYSTSEYSGLSRCIYWFLCPSTDVHFKRTTIRRPGEPIVRVGMDPESDPKRLFGSFSKDYIQIDGLQLPTLVFEVPDGLLPDGLTGVGIEFRGVANEETLFLWKKDLASILSFLFGGRLVNMGYTKIIGDGIEEISMVSPSESSIYQCRHLSTMPPVHFNLTYEWGDVEFLVNRFLPFYFELKDALNFEHLLDRMFTALRTPHGSNLPIMASAIEILASSFLKRRGKLDEPYMDDESYTEMIKEETASIAVKLSSVAGSDKILNKIRSANRRGPGEKMSLFFEEAGIKLGKVEKKAIALRNKMVHSAMDYEEIEDSYDDIVLTRVYQSLFNRTLLKLLGFNGGYIDYSMTGSPSKLIDLPAGNNK